MAAYTAVYCLLFPLYLGACWLVLRRRADLSLRPALVGIAGVAILARGLLVFAAPTLSDDMYRYIWDGRVQAAGLSPYAYPPGAPEVAGLHPPADPIWPHINRKGAVTIYPPGAELFYAAVYGAHPDSVFVTKAVLVGVDLANCLVLLLLLQRLGLSPLRTLIYAWAPLPIIEFGGSGHIETLGILLTLLGLLVGVVAVQGAAAGGRRAGPALLAGAALAGAVLVKLIPLLLLAAWARRFGLKVLAWCVGLVGAITLGYLVAYGGHVSPFLVTYLRDESGNAPLYYALRYGIAPLIGLSDGLIRLALFVGLAGTALAVALWRERDRYHFIGKSFILVAAYLLFTPNAQQWYGTWLLAFVPLFLGAGGLTLTGGATASGWMSRAGHRLSLVALGYTGLIFLTYSLALFATP